MAREVQDEREQGAEEDGGSQQGEEVVVDPCQVDGLLVECEVVDRRQSGCQVV